MVREEVSGDLPLNVPKSFDIPIEPKYCPYK